MQTSRFDLRDLFRAPRLAFSLQRIWIQLLGMAAGYLLYLILTYAAMISQGYGLADLWQRYGLLPCLFGQPSPAPWYSWLLFGLASAALLLAYMVTNTAVARAAYMTMKGNNFYSWREAFAFARQKFLSILFAPLSLLLLILLLVFSSWILGCLGRIPFLGELGISFFTVLWFLGALFLVYTGAVAIVSIWQTPAIIAASDEDAFEAVFQSFSLTWMQPCRLLFYQIVNMAVAAAAMLFFAFLLLASLRLMNALLGAFMGSDYHNLSFAGQAMVQSWLSGCPQPLAGFINQLFDYQHVTPVGVAGLTLSIRVAAFFFAVNLLFIIGWVLSYGLSAYTTGNLLTYLALRHRKDGEDLLLRKDREEEPDETAGPDSAEAMEEQS